MSTNIKERIYVCKEDTVALFENNLVTLTLSGGEVYEALEPRRLFPVSRADSYITLLDKAQKRILFSQRRI